MQRQVGQARALGASNPILGLGVNALDMAIKARSHRAPGPRSPGHLVGLREKIRSAGLMSSFGTVGDGLGSAMIESLWSSMQIHLLNRPRWRTRVELASAMFNYIETFYNRQRRHTQLAYHSRIEHELAFTGPSVHA